MQLFGNLLESRNYYPTKTKSRHAHKPAQLLFCSGGDSKLSTFLGTGVCYLCRNPLGL